jgi:hypothetical protein
MSQGQAKFIRERFHRTVLGEFYQVTQGGSSHNLPLIPVNGLHITATSAKLSGRSASFERRQRHESGSASPISYRR